jgi:hypothetical protein
MMILKTDRLKASKINKVLLWDTEAIATHHHNLIKNLNFFRQTMTEFCFYLTNNIVEI